MKEKLKGWLSFLSIALFIYLFINIEIFLWNIVDPEGFWGFFWFYTLSFTIFSAFTSLVGLIGYIIQNKSEKGIIKIIPAFVAIIVIGSVLEFGPTFFITRTIYNKYKYTEQSDKYLEKGQYEKALKYAEKVYSKAINKDLPTPFFFLPYYYEKSRLNSIDYYYKLYNATFNYAYCLQVSGKDVIKAEKLFKTCITICHKYFPGNTNYITSPLTSCFTIYVARGDRQKSDSTYLVLSKYLNKLDEHDVENTVSALLIYSTYAKLNGEIEDMFKLQKQALSIYERSHKESKSLFHLFLRTIVIASYIENSDLISAAKLVEETESIANRNDDKEPYVYFLTVKSRLFNLTGNLEREEDILNEITDEVKDRQGKESIEYSLALYNQGVFYYKKGQLKDAASYFDEAILIATPYSTEHPRNYYDLLLGSAICDYSSGNRKRSTDKLSKVNLFLLQSISTNLMFLSESEKENYVISLSAKLNLINSIYASMNDSALNGLLYDNILATKGIALQSNQYFRHLVLSSGKGNYISQYNSINRIKDSLNTLSMSGMKNELALSQRKTTLRQLEKKFIQEFVNTPGYRSNDANSIRWRDIRNQLQKDEVAIEYICTSSISNLKDQSEYYALIIKPDSQFPILIPLFKDKAIRKILNVAGNTSEKINTIYSGESLIKIYNQTWRPLLPYISGSKTIYISLSGVLYQLSFPIITANEPFNIICLSSTRKILPSQIFDKILSSKEAILYGDINYNETSKVSSEYSQMNFLHQPNLTNFVTRSGFQPLPYTKIEIEKIFNILSKDKYKVMKMVGSFATEESFNSMPSYLPNILHIATHGFYFPPSQTNNEFWLSSLSGNSSFESQNPLFRSGLLLAGANKYSKKTSRNDGIITAYEISKLDLSYTDLVVLSACETGLGDIKGDEGVFGLQRAFKLAGVNSIIMSLWKIPDQQTAELMQYFYKFYISGKSKNESLKLAQKRISLKYPNPYYWAAFVLID